MIATTVAAVIAAVALAAAPVEVRSGHTGHKQDAAVAQVVIVDLNTADATELMRLPGVGPKRAEAILSRRSKGTFTRVTQLLEVKGIGKKTLERLKPHVRVAAPPSGLLLTPSPH